MEDIIRLASYFGVQIPLLIAWVVGIVLAIKNWTQYPKVSLLATIGFIGLIIETLVFTSLNLLLPKFLTSHNMLTSANIYFMMVGIIRSCVMAICWGLIITALFGWRNKQ